MDGTPREARLPCLRTFVWSSRVVRDSRIMRTVNKTLVSALVVLALGCGKDASPAADTDSATGGTDASTGAGSTGPTVVACEGDVIVPLGTPIEPEGIIDPLEWSDATIVEVPVQDKTAVVLIKHDGTNLLLAYQPLASGGVITFPEVLIDSLNDKTEALGADDWWFLGYGEQECRAAGAFDEWDNCVDEDPTWTVTKPLTGSPLDKVEMSIPLASIEINPDMRCNFGIAFGITNNNTLHALWPETTDRSRPVTWATAALTF